ncbi:MAG: hypothetical protein GXO44_06010 [Deferribacteres bacterium]|nr:hypothetical protein [Deferribacteres bacterium]
MSLDPRVRIIAFFLVAVSVALSRSFSAVLFFLPYLVFILFLERVKPSHFKKLIPANLFLVFIFLTVPLREALLIFVKCNLILSFLIVLVSTERFPVLIHALHHLKLPDKLVHLVFFTYRYVHIIDEEYRTFMKAAKARGFHPKTDRITYKTLSYILANLIVRSYEKSKWAYKSMVCRGFHGVFPLYYHFEMGFKDLCFLGFTFVYVGALWARYSGLKMFM